MRVQKIVFNSITLTFTYPARPWVPRLAAAGAGIEWAASGVPSAWITRRDRELQIVQRFLESEWPQVRAFLEWAQEGGTFSWFPDASAGTSHTCYLIEPRIDQPVMPVPTDHFGLFELTMIIRRTDGAAIEPEYF